MHDLRITHAEIMIY